MSHQPGTTSRANPEDRDGDRDSDRDGGFSLPELMVTMAVTSIVLTAVATVFVGSLKMVMTVRERTNTATDARTASEAVTRTIRVAVRPKGEAAALLSATGNTLTFYSTINRSGTTTDPLPTKIEYYWTGGCLYEATTPARTLSNPAASGPFYAWDTSRAARCLARTATAPTFTYFTSAQIASGGADLPAMTVPPGGLTATNLALVQSIQVLVTVTEAQGATAGTTVLDRVTLNNVFLDDGT